jgi:hypothetical protein
MTTLKQFAICILTVLALYSCGEKEKITTPPIERAEMLMNGKWKLTEAYSNTEKNGVYNSYDLYNALPDCEKDNILKFSNKNEVEEDQGATKCNPADSQVIIEERWALVGNSALEFINLDLDTARGANILELSDELLHLRMAGTLGDGTKFEDTYKYKKVQ